MRRKAGSSSLCRSNLNSPNIWGLHMLKCDMLEQASFCYKLTLTFWDMGCRYEMHIELLLPFAADLLSKYTSHYLVQIYFSRQLKILYCLFLWGLLLKIKTRWQIFSLALPHHYILWYNLCTSTFNMATTYSDSQMCICIFESIVIKIFIISLCSSMCLHGYAFCNSTTKTGQELLQGSLKYFLYNSGSHLSR